MSSQVAEVSTKYLVEAASNAVPLGYKQTDVGLIPEDWEVTPLGLLIDSSDYGSSAKSHAKGVVPVLRMGNLQDGKIEWNDLVYTSDENEIRKYYLRTNDVLFNRTNSIELVGKTSIYRGERESIFAGYLIRIKTNHDRLNPEYLNYILNTPISKSYGLKVVSMGVSQANINGQKLKTYPIPHPIDVNEQTAIANALSDVDALISELEKLIAKKQAIKTATMQQLLTGRTRLPQFALHEDGTLKGTKPSELGEIPEDWEVVEFSSIVWFQEGPGVRQYQFTSAGIKLLNGTNIENGSLLLEKTQRFISEKLAYGQYSHFMIDAGDILIACSGVTIERFDEKVTVVSNEDLPLCLNTSTMRFKVRSENTDKIFIKNFLKSSFFKDQIGGKATGSAQLNFGPYHVNQVKIAVPNKEEQTAIATILSDMDEEIQALEQRLGKTRQIKQGMMQELLTGKTRLLKGIAND
jgi:type I restriction enzyme S subunit